MWKWNVKYKTLLDDEKEKCHERIALFTRFR